MRTRSTSGAVLGAAFLFTLLAAASAAQTPQPSPDGPASQDGTGNTGGDTQQGPVPGPGPSTARPGSGPSPGEPGFLTNLFGADRPNLLGHLYGLRDVLDRYGIALGLQETSEVLGNVTGGIRRGAAYDGLTTLSLGLDTDKAFGWSGGILNVSAFQIHGRNLSAENLLTSQTASGIEATRATRLWELWFQQSLLGGKLDIKIGQQSLDTEFFNSQGSGLFINTAAGWPLLPSANLYGGGPAYPLASLGVRVRAQLTSDLTVLAGVYDDNPAGTTLLNGSQVRGAAQSGTRFNLGTGVLAFAEAQYTLNPPPASGGSATGLPGVYKLGAWYDSATFRDQRFDGLRVSLADPASSGDPRARRHNWSLYGVFDQALWRPAAESPQVLGIFARLMGGPGDRNPIAFSVNAGVTLKAPFAGRDNDTAGLGFGVARFSASAIRADQDNNAFNGPYPVRGSETFLEATYQLQVAPWWFLQPDAQYVFSPAGGVRNPQRPDKRVGNSALFGLRTNIVF